MYTNVGYIYILKEEFALQSKNLCLKVSYTHDRFSNIFSNGEFSCGFLVGFLFTKPFLGSIIRGKNLLLNNKFSPSRADTYSQGRQNKFVCCLPCKYINFLYSYRRWIDQKQDYLAWIWVHSITSSLTCCTLGFFDWLPICIDHISSYYSTIWESWCVNRDWEPGQQ